MKHIIFWNCRGARKKKTGHVLQGIIANNDVSIVGLFETQVENLSRLEIDRLLGRDWDFFHHPSLGKSGGIIVLWKSALVSLNIVSHSAQCILTSVSANGGVECQVGFIYANKDCYIRRELWSEISANFDVSSPIVLGGDFNCITSQVDKKGGKSFSSSTGSREMVDFLSSMDLHDVGFSGPRFTWTNNKQGNSKIWIRHDRVYINSPSLHSFPFAQVLHQARLASDHCPLLLHLSTSNAKKMESWIRFEDTWLSYPGIWRIVQRNWHKFEHEAPDVRLQKRCTKSLKALYFWNKNTLTKLLKSKSILEGEIIELQTIEASTSGLSIEQEQILKTKVADLHLCLGRLTSWWRQRAKVRWIKEGDQNSHFFHTIASSRRRGNGINSLQVDGELTREPSRIHQAMVDFFMNKWHHTPVSLEDWPSFSHLPNVGELFGDSLMAEFSDEEIYKVVCGMGLNKAPGLDGITTSFFKAFWPTVGYDVCAAIKHFFSTGSMLQEWKKTVVVLIPKNDNPNSPDKLRPISLCQSIYKIVAKLLVLRIKNFLPQLISLEQAAFVPSRSISQHVLLAQEICNKFKNSKSSKGMFLAKIDMSQAYDRMNWDSLRQVLIKFSFPTKFISFIMECISNPTFSILINGRRSKLIQATCGFRQGCPLSPYLFILCSELLSLAIHQQGRDLGLAFSPQGTTISHLLYADDILIFANATLPNLRTMKNILENYCKWTGQQINSLKSAIMFNRSMRRVYQHRFARWIGFPRVEKLDYLGVPLVMRSLVKNDFSALLYKSQALVSSWGVRLLSMAGRSLLIRSSLLSLPTYLLAHCAVPSSALQQIEKIARSFLWQLGHAGKGMHYVSWENCCQPIANGGLGFQSFSRWRGPLRSRLAFSIFQDQGSLLSRCIMEKYGENMWDSNFRRGDSSTWKILCDGAAYLRLITRWSIGDGTKIDVTRQAWIMDLPLDRWPTYFNTNVCSSCRVNDILLNGAWDATHLHSFFGSDLVDVIMKIPINPLGVDMIELNKQLSGLSTTSLAYAMEFPTANPKYLWLKRLRLQPRVHTFWWRILWNAIPSKTWLASHRLTNDCQCPWGCLDNEDLEHIVIKCHRVEALLLIFDTWGFALPRFATLEDFFEACDGATPTSTKALQLYCLMIYHTWRNRNDKTHGKPHASSTVLAATILATFSHIYSSSTLEQWATTQPLRLITSNSWCPPPPGWIKVNVDGALLPNHLAGVGFCFRDAHGHALSCGGDFLTHWDAAQVEMLALSHLHKGIKTDFYDMDGIIIEGDNRNIILWFQKCFTSKSWADFSHLEATMAACFKFKTILFNVVPRNCNKMAHACAHLSLSTSSSFLWDDIPNDCAPLFSVFQEDLGIA